MTEGESINEAVDHGSTLLAGRLPVEEECIDIPPLLPDLGGTEGQTLVAGPDGCLAIAEGDLAGSEGEVREEECPTTS